MERTNEGRIDAKLLTLNQQGFGATEIAKKMGVGKSTVYKVFKEIGWLWGL